MGYRLVVYPSLKKTVTVADNYKLGEMVLASGKKFRGPLVGIGMNTYNERILHIFNEKKNRMYYIRPSKLLRIFDQSDNWIFVVEKTIHFRRLAATQIRHDDIAIDIGCSFGDTTELISTYAKKVIGFDISTPVIDQNKEKFRDKPNVSFEQVDCFAEWGKIIQSAAGCNVVFLDIGGDRMIQQLSRLIPRIIREFSPRLVVVKSKQLYKMTVQQARKEQETKSEGMTSPNTPLVEEKPLEGEHSNQFNETLYFQNETELKETETWWKRLEELAVQETGLKIRNKKNSAFQYYWENPNDADDKVQLEYALYYPKRDDPETGVRICRYHNYNVCLKGDRCEFSHTTCNNCMEKGHLAKNCPKFVRIVSKIASDS